MKRRKKVFFRSALYRDAMFSTLDIDGWKGWLWDSRHEANILVLGAGIVLKDGKIVPAAGPFDNLKLYGGEDIKLALGGAIYLLFGGGVSIEFNVTEFFRQLNSSMNIDY